MALVVHAGDVTITMENGARHVTTGKYEAVIANDGCLTNLLIDGHEFFRSDVGLSRGSYFHQGDVLKLPNIEQPADNVIVAKGDHAAIRYEFAPDSMTWSLENATVEPIKFIIVFAQKVSAEKGDVRGSLLVHEGSKSAWLRDKARLEIEGSTRFWGPWRGSMMWNVALAPHEKRSITFRIGTAAGTVTTKTSAVTPATKEAGPGLTLLSPKNCQIFQRQSKFRGRILVSGRAERECDTIAARLSGKSPEGRPLPGKWQPVPLEKLTRSFYVELPAAAGGWYAVEIRAMKGSQPVAMAGVDKVGVGEVFAIAGQSTAANANEERAKPASGMVSFFNDSQWQLADNSQPDAHDETLRGGFWLAFGDAMAAKYHVPIGIATTSAWQPGGELHDGIITSIRQLGPAGFRAVLWHQTEADAGGKPEYYYQDMTAIIRASTALAGWQFPWFVAHVSHPNVEKPSSDAIRLAQNKLWDDGIALEGPDADTLDGTHRINSGNGVHFNLKGLAAYGKIWAGKVGAYLDRVLLEESP